MLDTTAPQLALNEETFLSPQWLSAALRSTRLLPANNSVSQVRPERLSGGLMANTYILHLSYLEQDDALPASIVAKFPSSNPDSRAAGKEMLAYEREVKFYKEISARLSIKVPALYYADIDTDTGNFALLIEHLDQARVVTSGDCNFTQLKASIRELAKLHADTWNRKGLPVAPWILAFDDAGYQQQYLSWSRLGLNIMLGAQGVDKPEYFEAVSEGVINCLKAWPEYLASHSCLIHCDYRLSNLLYLGDSESVAVDWQTLHIGNPGFDTFYFIHSSQVSDEEGLELLRAYYDVLSAQLGDSYSWDACLEDYYLGVIYAAFMVMVTTFGVGANSLSEVAKAQIFSIVPVYWGFIERHKIIDRFMALELEGCSA